MRVYVLAFITFFVGAQAMGQNRSIDSLSNLYSNSNNAGEKIALKCKISQGYTEIGDFNKAGEFAENALKEAQNLNDKKGTGLAFYTLARLNQYMRDWDNALIYHYQAVQLFDEVNAHEDLAWTYLNMGIAFDAKKDYKRAIRYENKALEFFIKIDHQQGEAYTYFNLGSTLHKKGSKDKALVRLSDAKKICVEIGDQKGVGYVHNILGDILLKAGKLDAALKENKDCILIRESENGKRDLAFLFGNVGNIYFQQNKLKKAEEALIKAEKIGLEIKADLALKNLYLTWSKLDSVQGNYREAYIHFKTYSKYATIISDEEKEGAIVASDYAFKKEQEALAAVKQRLSEESNEKQKKQEAEIAAYKNKQAALISVAAILLLLTIKLFKKGKKNS